MLLDDGVLHRPQGGRGSGRYADLAVDVLDVVVGGLGRDEEPIGDLAGRVSPGREEHGSNSAIVFRDPSETDRVWVVFDWDEQGWQSFVSDPTVPPIMKDAGHKSRPEAAQFAGRCDA